jgi:hypothetical protein
MPETSPASVLIISFCFRPLLPEKKIKRDIKGDEERNKKSIGMAIGLYSYVQGLRKVKLFLY